MQLVAIHAMPLILTVLVLLSGCDRKIQPAIISGGSMYPSMPGQHYAVKCSDCNFGFKFDAYKPPRSGYAVCPNCGFTEIKYTKQHLRPPTKPIVKPITSPLKRWQTVAFTSRQVDKLLVKRIVALPDEAIQASNGNLFIDEEILVKPFSIYKQVRELVYDSSFASGSSHQRLVQVDSPNWVLNDNTWQYNSKTKNTHQHQAGKLKYKHIRGYRHSGQRNEPAPIEDSYSFNQNVSRELFAISELEVVLNMSCSADAVFSLVFKNSRELKCRIKSGLVQFIDNGSPITEPTPCKLPYGKFNLSVAAYDGHMHFQVENRTLLKNVITIPNGPTEILIVSEKGKIQINRFQVYRDGYHPNFDKIHCKNGFFLLGDNIPISIDSRNFGCVKKNDILGTVNFDEQH